MIDVFIEKLYYKIVGTLNYAKGFKMDGENKKSFLGIMFECCNVYARVYKNKEGTAYVGRCPKCLRRVSVKVGQGGTNQRFFKAR